MSEPRRLRVKVDVDTATDRLAVWKDGLGWVEFETAELVAAIQADVTAPLKARLAFLEPLVADVLKPDGAHRLVGPDGYCPDCGGGCLKGFTQPTPFVEPSPFEGSR